MLLIYLFLGAVGLGGLIVWTGVRLQIAAMTQTQRDLEQQAEIVADAFRDPLSETATNAPSLQGVLRRYTRSADGRLTLVDAYHRVIFCSDRRVPLNEVENHPEFDPANAGQGYYDIRWDETSGVERFFVAVPITDIDDNVPVAFVQLSIPMPSVYGQIGQIWLSLFLAGIVILTITAVASLLLARQIARPIQTLTAVTEAMAAGDVNHQVEPAGPDEVRRLGHAFNRMAERVRDTLEGQNAFVAHAAHDLRSPLAGIRLRLDMLQGHCRQDPELVQRYLGQMEQEVDYLKRLVDHLLVLSTLDAGEDAPTSALDLAPLLYEVTDEMSLLAREAGLRLTVEVPAHLPPVEANADQMRAVIRNLLDNAIKYTTRGGMITLCARGDEKMVITVSDTGIGIPAESLPHIFERFYRVDKAHSRQQGGSGLGLAMVRSIVEARGGEIAVDSEPGRGSVFTLSLPLAKETA